MQLQFIALRNDSRKTAEYQEILKDLINLITTHLSPICNWEHIELTLQRTPLPTTWEGAHADIVFAHSNGHIAYLMLHTQPWTRVKDHVEALKRQSDESNTD
ncbi:MAG: hypothetical protein AB7D01_06165 [Methanoculleus sp.]